MCWCIDPAHVSDSAREQEPSRTKEANWNFRTHTAQNQTLTAVIALHWLVFACRQKDSVSEGRWFNLSVWDAAYEIDGTPEAWRCPDIRHWTFICPSCWRLLFHQSGTGEMQLESLHAALADKRRGRLCWGQRPLKQFWMSGYSPNVS